MDQPQDIKDILKERGSRYGKFTDHARLSQKLQEDVFFHLQARNQEIEDDQTEALILICHKLARICNGDPHYGDSWRDIAGYATLVADRLEGKIQ
jgi:hypothetical protein